MEQNSRCRLCGDIDETINNIISECSKLAKKEYKTRHNKYKQVDALRIGQKIEIWPYEQMVYAQPRICPGKWDAQTRLGFWLVWFLCLMAYQLFLGYLMPKPFS